MLMQKLHITPTVYFVKFASDLTDTLFLPGGTASGTFKLRKNGILFHKPTGEPFAFLVANRHNERFFVSCSKQKDGRIRYMHSTMDCTEARLGISEMGIRAKYETAERVWDSIQQPA